MGKCIRLVAVYGIAHSKAGLYAPGRLMSRIVHRKVRDSRVLGGVLYGGQLGFGDGKVFQKDKIGRLVLSQIAKLDMLALLHRLFI